MGSTRLSFSFDSLLKELERILNSLVIKRNYIANQYEDSKYKADVDRYMTALSGESNFYTYDKMSDEVLSKLGYSEYEINYTLIDKYKLQQDGLFEKALKLQDEYVIRTYIEHNSYYRELNGLPNLKDTEYFYASEAFYREYNLDYKPVHEFNDTEIKQLRRFGEFDSVVTSNIADKVEMEDGSYISRNYLKHLGVNRIPIHKARKSLNFDLLFMDSSSLNEFLHEEFRKTYDTMREYYSGTLYNRDISNMIPGYDTFIGIMILMRTIQNLLVKTIKYSIERNYFDLRTIRLVYDAYGIPFNQSLSIEYHKSILRNINYLIEHKASDHCINELFNILSTGDIGLYRYYLVKNHMIDNGNPVFKYKQDFLGNTVLDKEAMYNFYFQLVDTRISNITSVFKDSSYTEPYESITGNDQYWIEDDETKKKLLNSKFNYIETKYLGISIMKQMTSIIFETQYALRLIIDRKKDVEKIQVHVAEIGDMDLFTSLVCLFVLFCKKYGYIGNIISDPTQIYSVYGFNVKEDVQKAINDIKNSPYYDNRLSKLFNSISINSKEDLDTLFKDIEIFRDIVVKRMYFASHINAYRLYERLYRTILISKESDEMFTKKDGTISKTYFEWLIDKNKDLSIIINEISESEIADTIDSFINSIVDVIPNLNNAYAINDGDTVLVETIVKLVMFFKSYSTDIIKLNTNFVVNDINNKLKFIDSIDTIISEVNMKSSIRGSFHSLIFNILMSNKDKIKLEDKVTFIRDK